MITFREYFLNEGSGEPGVDMPVFWKITFPPDQWNGKSVTRNIRATDYSKKKWAINRAAASVLKREGKEVNASSIAKFLNDRPPKVEDITNTPPKDFIQERWMPVPERLYDSIRDFYVQEYTKYQKAQQKGTIYRTAKKFFPINWKGTKWRKYVRNRPDAGVYVHTSLDTVKNSRYWDDDSVEIHLEGKGHIQLSLLLGVGEIIEDTIEHEMVHYLQRLIAVSKNVKHAGFSKKKTFKGRPVVTDTGELSDTEHIGTPYETQTNVVSTLRLMQRWYRNDLIETGEEDNLDTRKKYVIHYLKHLASDMDRDGIPKLSLKQMYPELFKEWMKSWYFAFVHGENSVNWDRIEELQAKIQEVTPKKEED